MSELAFIADQLKRLHQGDAWHGPSVREAIDGVTASLAGTRVVPHAHTIFALTHHIAAWADEVRQRLAGRAPQAPDAGDFPAREGPVSDAEWATARRRLDETHAALEAAILAFDARRLDAPVGDQRDAPLGTGVTYRAMLHGLVQHDAYHAGQLVLLRRALG